MHARARRVFEAAVFGSPLFRNERGLRLGHGQGPGWFLCVKSARPVTFRRVRKQPRNFSHGPSFLLAPNLNLRIRKNGNAVHGNPAPGPVPAHQKLNLVLGLEPHPVHDEGLTPRHEPKFQLGVVRQLHGCLPSLARNFHEHGSALIRLLQAKGIIRRFRRFSFGNHCRRTFLCLPADADEVVSNKPRAPRVEVTEPVCDAHVFGLDTTTSQTRPRRGRGGE
mmetsp:Transcript_1590/g.5517  ORF Transcript_1590/g.5517 Transcript_1590/m.5517 type:complete len:222 (-) Transcript_1590:183-848(-)